MKRLAGRPHPLTRVAAGLLALVTAVVALPLAVYGWSMPTSPWPALGGAAALAATFVLINVAGSAKRLTRTYLVILLGAAILVPLGVVTLARDLETSSQRQRAQDQRE